MVGKKNEISSVITSIISFDFLDTSLLSLLAYSTSTIECAFEIVLVLSTLASLSDIARKLMNYTRRWLPK